MAAFNVFQKVKGKMIKVDTVFFSGVFTPDDVKKSLVSHDGYDGSIVVKLCRHFT